MEHRIRDLEKLDEYIEVKELYPNIERHFDAEKMSFTGVGVKMVSFWLLQIVCILLGA